MLTEAALQARDFQRNLSQTETLEQLESVIHPRNIMTENDDGVNTREQSPLVQGPQARFLTHVHRLPSYLEGACLK